MNPLLEKELLKKIIPYQRCPICEGTGFEIIDGEEHICTVCRGKKVIPMHILNEKERIKTVKTLL